MAEKNTLGLLGENLVAAYLKERGFLICEQNYKKFYGEIDIVAQQNNLIIFVEVKMRKKAYFHLSHLVTPSKQYKIIKTAESYIASKKLYDHTLRFDVALVEGFDTQAEITYIPNAFSEPEKF